MGKEQDELGKGKPDNEFSYSVRKEEGLNGLTKYVLTPVESERELPKGKPVIHESKRDILTDLLREIPSEYLITLNFKEENLNIERLVRCKYQEECPTLQTLERLSRRMEQTSKNMFIQVPYDNKEISPNKKMVEQLRDTFCNSGTSCHSCPTYETLESTLPFSTSLPDLK